MVYSTMDLELPRYSVSVAAPEYSFEPACGERTLEQTPRSTRPLPESSIIRHSGKTTVVLHNQEENARIPSYGREASISGSVLFDVCETVSEVSFEVFGKLETMSSEGGASTTPVIELKRLLWSKSVKGSPCPSQLGFSLRLPATFKDESGDERPLPPSYAVDFHGVPGLFIRTSYFMQILITRTLSKKVGFLTKTKRIFIPFEYYPRTRPHRPIVDSPCFYSGVKTTPEEWHQTMAPMKAPQNSESEEVYAHLLVPSSRIYGIRETIPFHVQLSGPEDALRAFLQPKSKESPRRIRERLADNKIVDRLPSLFPNPNEKASASKSSKTPLSSRPLSFDTLEGSNLTSPMLVSHPLSPVTTITNSPHYSPPIPEPSTPLWLDDETRPTLRVFLLRQITLETRSGKKTWRNQILGEAKLVTVPPLLSASCYSPYGVAEPQVEDHLDWEGEMEINERFKVGGWQAAGVHGKDFIALSVVPQNERTSAVYGIQLTVPVKLVTDPWTEGANGFAVPLEAQ